MRLSLSALALCLAPLIAHADPVVVELYTSQGCSSCPPADAMLGELTAREDVIALSMHVDYWDWIGWEDTFGSGAFSERQRAYAAAVGSSVVYTPQFIIDGAEQVAGPSGMKLAEMIDRSRAGKGDVLIATGRTVAVPETGMAGQLILVTVEPEATVKIMRGENAGREITYHNIVRAWDVVANLDGSAMNLPLPAPVEGMRQVVLAQAVKDGKPGRILGAVALD
ncbi:MAG: DUF1223 domain-containing protein [Pseudomonadota bacterium]